MLHCYYQSLVVFSLLSSLLIFICYIIIIKVLSYLVCYTLRSCYRTAPPVHSVTQSTLLLSNSCRVRYAIRYASLRSAPLVRMFVITYCRMIIILYCHISYCNVRCVYVYVLPTLVAVPCPAAVYVLHIPIPGNLEQINVLPCAIMS